jgi:hypothetical protein
VHRVGRAHAPQRNLHIPTQAGPDQKSKLVVAAIESGGRWDVGFIGYIKGYIKAAHPDDTKSFVYQLKAATQRISIALQRSTARAILEMNRRAMTYPGTTI